MSRKKKSTNSILIIIFIASLLSAYCISLFLQRVMAQKTPVPIAQDVMTYTASSTGILSPEIKEIVAQHGGNEQKAYLLKLLKRVGPVEAQEELFRSGLPFNGETHLLAHTIGEYIYKKYGSSGLKLCKEYFLSACYHAFIIEDLSDHGILGLSETIQQCDRAGGIIILSQCAHASGHAFVVIKDYDLVSALKFCDSLGAKTKDFPFANCYDGVFMENLFSVHTGVPSPKRWIKPDDRYYPCDDPRIPEKYLTGCWSNQASLMYQMYQGDLKKVAKGCDDVLDSHYQETCYNNFARQIISLVNGSTDKVFEYCQQATGKKWQTYCLNVNVFAAFSVGDREKIPFEICHRIPEEDKKECYDGLIQSIGFLEKEKGSAQKRCEYMLDRLYKDHCIKKFS